MKSRAHDIEKRRRRMTEILLRHIAVVHHSALPSDAVRCVDLKRQIVIRPDVYQASAIADRAHPWSVLMCVMTTDRALHSDLFQAHSPCSQAELVEQLEEEHQRLLARVKIQVGLEGAGVQVHSFGWIAMPVQLDLEPAKAEAAFAAVLRSLGRVAA